MSLDNLPVEWLCVNGSDCVFDPKSDIVDGPFGSNLKSSEYTTSGIPVLRIQNIKRYNFVDKNIQFVSDEKAEMLSRHSFQSGDIVITKLGNPIALACIVPPKFEKGIIVADLVRMRPASYISTKYMMYYLNSKYVIDQVNVLIKGTTRPRINLSVIRDLKVVLPSLAEQQEIVRQLDVMLTQVEQIKARLDAIPALLKKFRQSVLADAVSGKLTEEWREGADFDIEAWTYERAEDLCLNVQSGSTPRNNPFDQNGTIPFLKVYNIVDQKISFDYKPQFILEDVHQNGSKRSTCKPFDVLMNIVGPPLGKIAIVTDQYPEWNINQAITMFRVNPEKLTYKFLYYVLCEGQIVRDVLHETKGSVGQINISLSQCRDALIPKPSLIEQDAIVETIDSLLGMAEKIENTVQLAQKRVNLLTQSILAKAFSGELTAEWREQHQELITGANSVESLLAKIQAEREVSKPVKKVKKVK